MLKINCPHCHKKFAKDKIILKSSKQVYKWDEIRKNDAFCPWCEKKFTMDITAKGILALLLVMLVLFFMVQSIGPFVQKAATAFLLYLLGLPSLGHYSCICLCGVGNYIENRHQVYAKI